MTDWWMDGQTDRQGDRPTDWLWAFVCYACLCYLVFINFAYLRSILLVFLHVSTRFPSHTYISVGGTSTSWLQNPASVMGLSSLTHTQHEISLLRYAGAIAFGVLLGAHASFWLDNKNWKVFDYFNEDLPKMALVPLTDPLLMITVNRHDSPTACINRIEKY